MTGKRFEVMDYFDSENKPIKAIRDTETTEIYSMDNELEANSTCGLLNALHEENEQLQSEISKLTDLLASEIEKNARLLQENNSLKIENMRLKESIKDLNDILARYEEKELKE